MGGNEYHVLYPIGKIKQFVGMLLNYNSFLQRFMVTVNIFYQTNVIEASPDMERSSEKEWYFGNAEKERLGPYSFTEVQLQTFVSVICDLFLDVRACLTMSDGLADVHSRMHTSKYACTHTCMYALSYTHTLSHMHTNTQMCICTHAQTYTYTHTHTHTHIHTVLYKQTFHIHSRKESMQGLCGFVHVKDPSIVEH